MICWCTVEGVEMEHCKDMFSTDPQEEDCGWECLTCGDLAACDKSCKLSPEDDD